jgi:hypothetical protein
MHNHSLLDNGMRLSNVMDGLDPPISVYRQDNMDGRVRHSHDAR